MLFNAFLYVISVWPVARQIRSTLFIEVFEWCNESSFLSSPCRSYIPEVRIMSIPNLRYMKVSMQHECAGSFMRCELFHLILIIPHLLLWD